ncbi:MAG: dihydrofolate reductase [Candidatus Competibacteraceae bacterium]|nr:dihydrofolate reductase [Candidatus Competibacteraceae bacterium]
MAPQLAASAPAPTDARPKQTNHGEAIPQLTLIAAVARNGIIGRKNDLPWHLPADLRFFRKTTIGKPVLMGRRTWQSIGRPLPDRQMIVLTHDWSYQAAGCKVAHSLEEALEITRPAAEIMVIGGAALFEQTLPLAKRMYLTQVEADVPGDTWFPDWNPAGWKLVWEEAHPTDEQHAWPFRFQRWERTHAS